MLALHQTFAGAWFFSKPLFDAFRADARAIRMTPESEARRMDIAARRDARYASASEEDAEAGLLISSLQDGVLTIPIVGTIFSQATYLNQLLAYYLGGTITEWVAADFKWGMANPNVKAIRFHVNSGGGDAFGLDALSFNIYQARGTKPIAAYVEGYNCSAAYYISSACDVIYSTRDSIHGSIGTMCSWLNFDQMMANEGVKEIILVAEISPDKVPDENTEEGLALLRQPINRLGINFVEAVARNRDVTYDHVLENYGRGWVKTGVEAVEAGLIDGIASIDFVLDALSRGELPDLSVLQEPENPNPADKVHTVEPTLVDQFRALLGFPPRDAAATPPPVAAVAPPAPAIVPPVVAAAPAESEEVTRLRAQLADTESQLATARAAQPNATATAVEAFRAVAKTKVAPAMLEAAVKGFSAMLAISPEAAAEFQASFVEMPDHMALAGLQNGGAPAAGGRAAANPEDGSAAERQVAVEAYAKRIAAMAAGKEPATGLDKSLYMGIHLDGAA